MNYIESNLLKNEKLVYCVRPHWIIFSSTIWPLCLTIVMWIGIRGIFPDAMIGPLSLQDLACVLLLAITAYQFLQAFIFYSTSEYGVTTKRVIVKVGWIQRESLELMLDKVEGVLVDQSVVGRIFNYGVITIIGTGGTHDKYSYIPDPLRFRKEVQQQIENFEQAFRVRSS